jgi:medium-chain acyl-[acyl-carrier-protein] hydrolase
MFDAETLHMESPYVRRTRRTGALHRLFCFPHAGAGASYFAPWAGMLAGDVELIAIQLPGREDRWNEPAFTQVAPLVRNLVLALRPYLHGSYSFFGHSGGALLAYELAHAVRENRRSEPRHLFLSGQAAPDAPVGVARLHDLPELQFRAAIQALGGLTSAVSENEDLMEIILPAVRADFTMWETYTFPSRPALSVPITALGGRRDDRTPPAGVTAWGAHTTGEFRSLLLEGDHFYLNGPNQELLSTVGNTIGHLVSRVGE